MPALFAIRTSVLENHLSVAQLAARDITAESLSAELVAGSLRCWLALVDSVPAGFSMAKLEEGGIFAMFVRPEREGLGLGRRLMAAAESCLFGHGCKEIWLTTDEDPTIRAHGFYRRLGWQTDWVPQEGEVTYWKRPGS